MPDKHCSRAKLFLPYDALKGFREKIKEKERIVVDRKTISQDMIDELNYSFSEIDIGDMIKVIHYENLDYIETTGLLSNIDINNKYLVIVKKRIYFKDIIIVEKFNYL